MSSFHLCEDSKYNRFVKKKKICSDISILETPLVHIYIKVSNSNHNRLSVPQVKPTLSQIEWVNHNNTSRWQSCASPKTTTPTLSPTLHAPKRWLRWRVCWSQRRPLCCHHPCTIAVPDIITPGTCSNPTQSQTETNDPTPQNPEACQSQKRTHPTTEYRPIYHSCPWYNTRHSFQSNTQSQTETNDPTPQNPEPKEDTPCYNWIQADPPWLILISYHWPGFLNLIQTPNI